jgi:sucrose-6-phosphate hydrolase SacC (GH32 family)
LNHPDDNSPARIYKIGHATSRDGIAWQKDGKQIICDKLNPYECQALPTVTNFDNRYHLFFCYREATDFRKNKHRSYRIGYAFSDDLNQWTRDDDNVGLDVSENDWDSDMLCYPHVFQSDGKIYLLYNGNEFGRFGFGLAVLENNSLSIPRMFEGEK